MKKIDLRSAAAAKSKKIDSPLAKYNSVGQLYCVLCNSQVKNEMFWTGHVNGKHHREALAALRAPGGVPALKRPAGPPPPAITAPSDHDFAAPQPPPAKKPSIATDLEFKVPAAPPGPKGASNGHEVQEEEAMEEEEPQKSGPEAEEGGAPAPAASLPAGFFDDPKEDAKARGLEWRNPEEVEWERFVKEIAGEEVVSSNLRTMDDEESTASRELTEIEEQMAHWQKVVEIERKIEAVRTAKARGDEEAVGGGAEGSEEEEEALDYEEELDWRSKRH